MKGCVVFILLCAPLFAASAPKTKKPDIITTIMGGDTARTIAYNDRDIPTVHTRMNYTTVFVLPKNEKVMDLLCGHAEEWSIQGADGTNFAYVKPEKAGARTNLNLVTASGNVYSFLLVEGEGNADLKVFVEPKDAEMRIAAASKPKWVRAAELEAAIETNRRDVDAAHEQAQKAQEDAKRSTEEAKAKADREISEFRSGFPSSLKFDYTWKTRHSLGITAVAHSNDFTYIWASPGETPTLYEKKDNKPSLVQFSYSNGVYVIPKVVYYGYLAVGGKRQEFKREGE